MTKDPKQNDPQSQRPGHPGAAPSASSAADWMFLQPAILDQMHDSVIVTDMDGIVTGCNRAALKIYGYQPAELIGQSVTILYPEGAHHLLRDTVIPAVLANGEFRGEFRNRTHSGDYIYINLSVALLRDSDGNPVGMVGFSLDVTAQKLGELAMRRSEQVEQENVALKQVSAMMGLMMTAVERSQDAILITEAEPVAQPGPRIVYVNQAFTRMTGYSPEEVIGKTPRILQGPNTDPDATERMHNALRAWQPVREELINYHKDGTEFYVDLSIIPIANEHGWYTHWFSIQRDTTPQNTTRRSLAHREYHLREAQRIAHLGVWGWDLATGKITWSEEINLLYGRDPSLSAPPFEEMMAMFVPESRARLQSAVERCLRSGEPYVLDLELRHRDGTTRWATARGEAETMVDGKPTRLRGTIQDITERKRSEQALMASEQRFRELAESLPEFVWMADAEGRKIYCNQRYFEYTGAKSLAEMDRLWMTFLHPDDLQRTADEWRRSLQTGEPYSSEYRMRRHDGSYRHFLARGVALRSPTGEVDRWLGSCTDVHDQKLAEATLRRTEKLAVVGSLASSMSHEINNPLEGITNLLYLLGGNPSLDPLAREYLASAEEQLARVSQVATQALRFHRQSSGPTEIRISELVSSLLSLNRPILQAKQIEVRRRYDNAPPLQCLAGEVRQALGAVLSNAIDALGTQGILAVRVYAASSAMDSASKGIRTTIADSGHGIPAENLSRIFEPFFSTKAKTGTGLGLWIAKGIIERHSGRIAVRSSTRPGNSGTVVSIFMPYQPDSIADPFASTLL